MNFAVILGGGQGVRMGNQDRPKQYLPLAGKPIIVSVIEKFLVVPDFEKVLVLCPESWLAQTRDILAQHFSQERRLEVLAGGQTRNETVMNAIAYVEREYGLDDDTVLVTHDAVRPFVSYRAIRENLDAMRDADACDTVVPATDTIVTSIDGEYISDIPNRLTMYQGQTPQTFKARLLKDAYAQLTDEQRSTLTDACKIMVLAGRKVKLVRGEPYNIKITYPSDFTMASALLGVLEDA